MWTWTAPEKGKPCAEGSAWFKKGKCSIVATRGGMRGVQAEMGFRMNHGELFPRLYIH